MSTVHETDRSPKRAEIQTRTYSVKVKTKEGMRKIKVIVKPRPAHEFRQLPDTNKEHFRAFLKGVGSIKRATTHATHLARYDKQPQLHPHHTYDTPAIYRRGGGGG